MLLIADRKPGQSRARTFDEIIALLDGGGMKTHSGAVVNSETAMRQATFYACVRIVSETIAQLPVEVQVKERGLWKSVDHDALGLLAEPNEWQTQHDLISQWVAWSEMKGNAYAYKNTNSRGKIMRLLPLTADGVQVEQLQDWSLQYAVTAEAAGFSGTYTRDKIFHLRNFGTDGFVGKSTLQCHRETIGLSLSLQQHAATMFKNGLTASKWVESASELGEEEKQALKAALKQYEGAENAGKTMLLQGGLKLHDIPSMTAADAQYIETMRFSKQDIASILFVPLFLLNDTDKSTTWGSGLEQLSKSYVRFSLQPRINRLSQTLVREIIDPRERSKTRFVFDTDGFTLGEFKERMEAYRAAIESGVLNPDECREIEGRNPRPDGGKYRIPVNIAIEGESNGNQDA